MIPLIDAAYATLLGLVASGCFQGNVERDFEFRSYQGSRWSRIVSYRMPNEMTVWIDGRYLDGMNECELAGTIAFHSVGVEQDRSGWGSASDDAALMRDQAHARAVACCDGSQFSMTQ